MSNNPLARLLKGTSSEQKRDKLRVTAEVLDAFGIERKELEGQTLSVSKELAEAMSGVTKMTEEDVAEMTSGIVEALASEMGDKGYMTDENAEDMRKAMTAVVERMLGQMRDDAEMMVDPDKKDDIEQQSGKKPAPGKDDLEDEGSKGLNDVLLALADKLDTLHADKAVTEDHAETIKSVGELADGMTRISQAVQDVAQVVIDDREARKSLETRLEAIEDVLKQTPRRASEAKETQVNEDDDLLKRGKSNELADKYANTPLAGLFGGES